MAYPKIDRTELRKKMVSFAKSFPMTEPIRIASLAEHCGCSKPVIRDEIVELRKIRAWPWPSTRSDTSTTNSRIINRRKTEGHRLSMIKLPFDENKSFARCHPVVTGPPVVNPIIAKYMARKAEKAQLRKLASA